MSVVLVAAVPVLLVGAEVLEDEQPGDQGWSFLSFIALFFVVGSAAYVLLNTLRAGVQWFLAARSR